MTGAGASFIVSHEGYEDFEEVGLKLFLIHTRCVSDVLSKSYALENLRVLRVKQS